MKNAILRESLSTFMHSITSQPLTLPILNNLTISQDQIELSKEVCDNIVRCRAYLDEKMKHSNMPIYGINTGFGSLCDVQISTDQLTQLQENLVRSHACGTGELVPKSIVKLMLLFKIKSLGNGNSGVHLATVQRLVDFYNLNILPVIYTQGSLGASGDLAPLAHMALSLIGEGEVWHEGEQKPTLDVLKEYDLKPIKLQSKEGLALLNGTQFMSAYAVHCLLKSYKLSYFSDLLGALSLDAFDGRLEPFDPLVQLMRPHKGQILTAQRIRTFLKDSPLISQPKAHVQDPYSFRCMPQVHGATKDALAHVCSVVLTEINSVSDNPNIFVAADKIISGGNFHGQPLALSLDFLKIALSELGSISERRTYQLISGQRGLPSFLVKSPGLNSGFMIPQYTAASIVSANKQLATPASVDSIVSSNGQEDHVSMGANAATQALKIVENVERILAIEMMNASQALAMRTLNTSPFLMQFLSSYRSEVQFMESDKPLYKEIKKTITFMSSLDFDNDVLFEEIDA
ncbi:MAG: histidine ammonia-lyase [Flavobacteriaceae bacterium]|nr:histidine ammonia-lyase [Flavobacteriaceae bacterium]